MTEVFITRNEGENMEFESFEQALEICLNAEERSPEQAEA